MFWVLLLQRGRIFYWHLALVLQRGRSFYWPLAKEEKCFWHCTLLLPRRGIEGGGVIGAAPSSCKWG